MVLHRTLKTAWSRAGVSEWTFMGTVHPDLGGASLPSQNHCFHFQSRPRERMSAAILMPQPEAQRSYPSPPPACFPRTLCGAHQLPPTWSFYLPCNAGSTSLRIPRYRRRSWNSSSPVGAQGHLACQREPREARVCAMSCTAHFPLGTRGASLLTLGEWADWTHLSGTILSHGLIASGACCLGRTQFPGGQDVCPELDLDLWYLLECLASFFILTRIFF